MNKEKAVDALATIFVLYDFKFRSLVNTIMLSMFLLLTVTGAVSNLNAVALNGGKMPVYSEYNLSSPIHFSFQDFSEVNVPYQTDIIHLFNRVMSIGDLMIFLGIFGGGLVLVRQVIVFRKSRHLTKQLNLLRQNDFS